MRSDFHSALVLLRFSIPLILSGVLQQLYSWADAFIVGHFIGEDALAAVGAVTVIINCVLMVITGFTQGLSVVAAQEFGRKEISTVREILSGFLVILTLICVVCSILGTVFTEPLLQFMDTPENIFEDTKDYLLILFIGIPFMCIYNLYAALLRAVGNTRSSFLAVILSSVMNVILDFLFVAILPFGVPGAACATALSQIAMGIFIWLYAEKKYEFLRVRLRYGLIHRKVVLLGLRYAVPLTVQQGVMAAGNVVLQGFMNSFGSHTVAAITSAYRVDSIMLLPLINIGSGVSTLVAQSEGAGQKKKAKVFSFSGLLLCLVIAFILAVTMYSIGGDIVSLFGIRGEAKTIANHFFRIMAFYYLPYGIVSALRGIVEGRGSVLYSSAVGVSSLILRVVLSFVMVSGFGNMAIAHAEGVQWCFMAVMFLMYFFFRRFAA